MFSNKNKYVPQSDTQLKRVDTVDKAILPIKRTEPNGVFLLTSGKYAKTFHVADINYLTADFEGQETIFKKYSDMLNSMLENYKITIITRKLKQVTDVDKLYFKYDSSPELNTLRQELNDYIKSLSIDANTYVQEIYITVTCAKPNLKEANTYFNRVEVTLQQALSKIGSSCTALNEFQKLELIYSFYNANTDVPFKYDRKKAMRLGHSYREYVCPDSFVSEFDYFRIGERFGQAMIIKDFPQVLRDELIKGLAEVNTEIAISIDVTPIPKDKAIKMAEQKILANETNITNYQRKQNQNQNWAAELPYDYRQQRAILDEFLDELTVNDQCMFSCTVTLVHLADSKDELDQMSANLISIASGCQTTLVKLMLPSRQRGGLISALPFGVDEIKFNRTLLTSGLAILMPFKIQDILHSEGIVCGVNKISGNLILVDRRKLKNGNSWILGKPGGGKSFFAKLQIFLIKMQYPQADIVVIDPEREYSPLVEALGGKVINVSSSSNNHINPMDMNENYSDDGADPLVPKSEFIMSIFEQISGGKVNNKHRSIIDRCTKNVYKNYIQNNFRGTTPTLVDLRNELLSVNDTDISKQVAQELAIEAELFTTGSLDTFAKQTNVELNNKLICYDILDLGSQLMPIGMLVVLDNILNKISKNRAEGKETYIFMDEIYLLFQHEYTSEFLYKLWKRIRKYGGYCIGITQNVEELLQSIRASTMLSNSEFVVMLSQSTSDKDKLSRLLNMSEEETKYITETSPGEGCIHIEDKNIPFVCHFPSDTKLYKLITTKPSDKN